MKSQIKIVIVLFTTALFYSCGNSDEKKIDGNAERDALENCLTLSLEANKLTQPPNNEITFDLPDTTEKEIIEKLEQSIEIGNNINDKFLYWLHDGLQYEFKEHFIKGSELYLEGLKTENVEKQIKGNKLTIEWNEYWNDNKEDILNKMFPKEN